MFSVGPVASAFFHASRQETAMSPGCGGGSQGSPSNSTCFPGQSREDQTKVRGDHGPLVATGTEVSCYW